MRPSPWTPTERTTGRTQKRLPEVAVEAGGADLLLEDRVGVAEDLEPLLVDLAADDPDRQAGARERLAPDHPLGEAELARRPRGPRP